MTSNLDVTVAVDCSRSSLMNWRPAPQNPRTITTRTSRPSGLPRRVPNGGARIQACAQDSGGPDPYPSKWVRTEAAPATGTVTEAATSLSSMWRAFDASRRILNASSWEHRFCAMIPPAARAITVRDSSAANRSSRANSSNRATSAGPEADGNGEWKVNVPRAWVIQGHRDHENRTESAGHCRLRVERPLLLALQIRQAYRGGAARRGKPWPLAGSSLDVLHVRAALLFAAEAAAFRGLLICTPQSTARPGRENADEAYIART